MLHQLFKLIYFTSLRYTLSKLLFYYNFKSIFSSQFLRILRKNDDTDVRFFFFFTQRVIKMKR